MKINGIKINTLEPTGREFEESGQLIRGIKGPIIINKNTHAINEYSINYLDIHQSEFIKAVINGKGDLWTSEWSDIKGQRVLGDYILHSDYIEPDNEARFVIGDFSELTIVLDTPDREVITEYNSDYTTKFSDVDYITLENDSFLVKDKEIHQIYALPRTVPEEYAEILADEDNFIPSPPRFSIEGGLFEGEVSSVSQEALGYGESIDFEARQVD